MSKRPPSTAGRCTYCERQFGGGPKASTKRTRDHLEPRSRGGTLTVPCCHLCNSLKGDWPHAQWVAFMREHPEWWLLPPKGHGGLKAARRKFVARWEAQKPPDQVAA